MNSNVVKIFNKIDFISCPVVCKVIMPWLYIKDRRIRLSRPRVKGPIKFNVWFVNEWKSHETCMLCVLHKKIAFEIKINVWSILTLMVLLLGDCSFPSVWHDFFCKRLKFYWSVCIVNCIVDEWGLCVADISQRATTCGEEVRIFVCLFTSQ